MSPDPDDGEPQRRFDPVRLEETRVMFDTQPGTAPPPNRSSVPGTPMRDEFARAERHRTAGQLEEAIAVAKAALAHAPADPEGLAVLCLSLLDAGRHGEVRGVLEPLAQALGDAPFAGGVSQDELDSAFAGAEPELENVMDADRVAQEAMRAAELDAPEIPVTDRATFATETMAGLLASQGDEAGASQIRAGLGLEGAPEGGAPSGDPDRRETLATLERWLSNLQELQ